MILGKKGEEIVFECGKGEVGYEKGTFELEITRRVVHVMLWRELC